jgi:glutamate dehydrogenase
MGTTNDIDQAIMALTAMAQERRPDQPLLAPFVERYYRELPDDDIDDRPLDEAYAAAVTHFEVGRRRAPGEVLVNVRTPDLERDGWAPNRSVLMFVTDDVPFLVDTVRMVLDRHGLGIDLLVHPMLPVQRNGDNEIVGFELLPDGSTSFEAWTQIQLDRCSPEVERQVEADVRRAIDDVMQVVGDFSAMRNRLAGLAGQVVAQADLLSWLAEQHFVFLGAASYERTVDAAGSPTLTLIDGSELGEYRPSASLVASKVWPPSKPGSIIDEPVVIARTDALATIHRATRMTSLAVRLPSSDGGSVVEHRFIGLLGSGAYRESVFAIPVLCDRATVVLNLSGATAVSHTGRAIKNVVETLPRDLLFELDGHTLAELVIDIVGLQERRIVRVFAVAEPVGDFTTVFVYLPKARFESGLQERVAEMVGRHAGGEVRDVSSLVESSSLARISMTVSATHPLDLERLGEQIDRQTASWPDRARSALIESLGEAQGRHVFEVVRDAVPLSYSSRVDPSTAVGDLVKVARLIEAPVDQGSASDLIETSLSRSVDGPQGEWRFRIFRRGISATIADLVPLLGHLGLHAVDEHPAVFRSGADPVYLYDIGVRLPAAPHASTGDLAERQHGEVQRAFRALVRGDIEADGLNQLVLVADLSVRQVAVLRCYSRYLQQAGFPFSQAYIEEVLVRHAPIAHSLVELFEARFNPSSEPSPVESPLLANATRTDIMRRLDDVPSLDDDRICRALLTLIDSTSRTNAFQQDAAGALSDETAVKLDAKSIPFLPEPRPMFEIFVCSPKVEGVHLRAGRVARGGLRWSDRREDYRTEVLGLVKAQMVKNAVIVPVGAKGGFVVKQPTAAPSDRDAIRAEGVDRYQRFVRSLLDVTDNLVAVDGVPTVVHPDQTVIYDANDPYLVVAADKGTATFSDIANQIAIDTGFWLADAFASGGSNGYDHKAMGITARGAWESVRRHARVIGKDVDTDELTAVGVGDMSGDVFGNGMLLSRHLKLIAAFDHRDVFLDPDPDPAVSFAERQRLFELPRSSWGDYDTELLSAGGGVHSRSSKSIPITDEVRRALGIAEGVSELRPNELLTAILTAPVDLLWNGGIGTYVKASSESNEEVGDRANDAIRVNGDQLRCRIVGEGGNLGLTQLARVEYALEGGLIYTDAIDNSAGVDCSDHEVNIKIALAQLVVDGTLSDVQRNALLVEMTDEVAELVLDDNRAQTLALMIARTQSRSMVNVHARYLDALEADGHIDRALEDLPNDKQIAERQSVGSGLRAPEFAVMIASTKNADIGEILETDLPDDPALEADLLGYFPSALRDRYPAVLLNHRLRREIITTGLVNNMVNLAGISFDHRMSEQSGASVADVTRAFVASREIVSFRELWSDVEALGSSVALDMQIELFLDVRRMAERVTTWLLRRRPAPLDISAAINDFRGGFATLAESLDHVVCGRVKGEIDQLCAERVAAGVPVELASRSAAWPWLHTGLDVIEVAHREGSAVVDTGSAYWAVFEAFDVGWLWDGIGDLPRSDRWQTQARASLRDDLMTVLADLTANVIRTAGGSPTAWIQAHEAAVTRVIDMETEIRRAETFDLTTLSVALRQLRNLTVTASG